MSTPRLLSFVSLCLALAACGDDATPSTRRGVRDAGVPMSDAGRTPTAPLDLSIAPPTSCVTGLAIDADGDGFPGARDCNDCSPQINPGAFDFPGNGFDEDCEGGDATADALECDRALAMASSAGEDAARAMGLCRFVDESSGQWGVVSARFVGADGSGAPASMDQIGLLPSLGAIAPQQGGAVLALSSGVARAPGQPGYTDQCDIMRDSASGYPPGYPTPSPACPGVVGGAPYDSAALELRIRVPTNARSLSFLSAFFTYEYPEFICDEFNDFFVVLREQSGSWENLVRDTMGNSISVNNAFLSACVPGRHGGRDFACPMGTAFLAGTGFDGSASCGYDPFAPGVGAGGVGASTGWLRTTSPVTPGQILTLRVAIWDSADPDLDSLALIDGWEWEVEAVETTETVPELI
jgi:hypothetical protein